MINTDLNIERKSEDHEFLLDVLFAHGKNDNETTEENGKLAAQYNYLFSRKVYSYINSKALYDEIAMIDYRLITGPGAGC